MEAASSYRFCKRQNPFRHECGQDTFISIIERLHSSRHVIFRISKLSPKSNVDQSGKRRTQSQTLPQNRDYSYCSASTARKVPFYYLKSLQGFSIEVSFTNPVNSNSILSFHFKSILKANCQGFGYVFGMKKEEQSGCAER